VTFLVQQFENYEASGDLECSGWCVAGGGHHRIQRSTFNLCVRRKAARALKITLAFGVYPLACLA
jgi:hypothetical protein